MRVHTIIVEGDKKRTQRFEGIVIAKKSKTFTVRKVSGGYGTERIYPIDSPNITKVEIRKKGKVRRAKLFYLRIKQGRKIKTF